MKDTELNKKLESYQAPAPSDLLKARILQSAANQATSRPRSSVRTFFSKRFMLIAASLLAVCAIGFGTLQVTQTTKTETAAWKEAAIDLGFDDIYDWVEAEEPLAQES